MKEESSQSSGMRINRQTSEPLKDAVLFQQVRSFDPADSETDRIDERQDLFGHAVAIVPASKSAAVIEAAAQRELFEEQMQQVDSAEVREVLGGEGNFEIFGSVAHVPET